jgi:hypothetical protein
MLDISFSDSVINVATVWSVSLLLLSTYKLKKNGKNKTFK